MKWVRYIFDATLKDTIVYDMTGGIPLDNLLV